jgi:hypothetical protein
MMRLQIVRPISSLFIINARINNFAKRAFRNVGSLFNRSQLRVLLWQAAVTCPSMTRLGTSGRDLHFGGRNRAKCSKFRRPLAQIARCAVCKSRHLSARLRTRNPDLGFYERLHDQQTRFTRFRTFGYCTSAYLCKRPSKTTAHRPFSARLRAVRPNAHAVSRAQHQP